MDKDGNIIQDSRRERIEKRSSLAELAERHANDRLLVKLLESFEAAINDPLNELVHLYEIRDALKTKFSGDHKTRDALGISRATWSRLGKLADHEPLRQSRHRGFHTGALRDATKSEVNEARAIARGMIEAYLRNLEKPSAVGG